MEQYLELMRHVLEHGEKTEDRTGTGTLSIFGYQMRFDLTQGFPLVTTKKVSFKRLVASELLWFLRGETNIRYLLQHHNHIWDDWPYAAYRKSPEFQGESMEVFSQKVLADEVFAARFGDLGPVYGRQWRSWRRPDGSRLDQIQRVIDQIRKHPESRRLLVVSYNPGEVDDMALPPCHTLFQFYVRQGRLSCQLYQRSADIFLGLPFNIASYALLTSMVAQVTGLKVGEFVHSLGDAHIYLNHLEQCRIQVERKPFPLPQLWLNPKKKAIDDFEIDDIDLLGYQSHPRLRGEVSV